jgi:hypothetical protein
MLQSALLLVLFSSTREISAWNVLNDTDFPHNCQNPYHPGASVEDCAEQCQKRSDCAAVSWNGPKKDKGCNFKCSTEGPTKLVGEQAIVVRADKSFCGQPPPPPAPTPKPEPCPASIPKDWQAACESANLFFSPDQSGGLAPEVGNGYIATVVQTTTIFAAGLFNGPASGTSKRARIAPYSAVVSCGTSADAAVESADAPGGRALDVQHAAFLQRRTLHCAAAPTDATACTIQVDERWFAPLHQPSLLVHEISLTNTGTAACTVAITSTPNTGGASGDFDMSVVTSDDKSYVAKGTNKVPEVANHTSFALAANVLPSSVELPPSSGSTSPKSTHLYALQAIVTSLNSSDPTTDAAKLLSTFSAPGR